MIVQIYETQDVEAARELVALGVDHVGVLAGPGEYPREIPPERAAEIVSVVEPPAKSVILSLSSDFDRLISIAARCSPAILHIGASIESFPLAGFERLREALPDTELMRSIPVVGRRSIDVAAAHDDLADYLLLDSHTPKDTQIGATGLPHDWTISREIAREVSTPVILAGGLGPENVTRAIEMVAPAGVDSKTATDLTDGFTKDTRRVREFVTLARRHLY